MSPPIRCVSGSLIGHKHSHSYGCGGDELRTVTCLATLESSNIEDWLVHVYLFLSQQDDVTDKRKYGGLIGALLTSVITTVQHVLTKPPATRKYDALKKAMKCYAIEDDESNHQYLLNITHISHTHQAIDNSLHLILIYHIDFNLCSLYYLISVDIQRKINLLLL